MENILHHKIVISVKLEQSLAVGARHFLICFLKFGLLTQWRSTIGSFYSFSHCPKFSNHYIFATLCRRPIFNYGLKNLNLNFQKFKP